MKLYKKLAIGLATLGFGLTTLMGASSAAQPPCYQYNANGFQTSQTPVFNDICGVPGVGNESNFVRIRQDSNGNDEDNANNPAYTVGTLDAACSAGNKFDIWNYVHNNAESQYNGNGSGSAVAQDVQALLTAKLGATGSSFPFTGTISADNAAASVTDSATLNCDNGQQVTLSLVPGSVHIVSEAVNSGAWGNLPDSTINSSMKLGSPVQGSGTMWGCWNYRIVIVYQVTVQPVVPKTPAYACTDLGLTAEESRTVKISNFTTTSSNGATFANVVIDWGDHTTPLTSTSPVGQTHQYGTAGNYTVTATAYFNVPGQNTPQPATSQSCAQPVTFTNTPTPPGTPPSTPPVTPAAPTALVNTGPGSVIGLFSAATLGGMVFYRRLLARRLSRQ